MLFFFVLSCVARDDEIRLGEKYRILNRSGMTEERMKREKRPDALFRTLPLALAFPAHIIIRFVSDLRVNLESIRMWAEIYAQTQHPSDDPMMDVTLFAYTLKLLRFGTDVRLAVIVIAVFSLICRFIISTMDKEWRKTP